MILHLLHNPALYRDCAALLTEHDTLLLLDDAATDAFIRSLTQLPCSVKVLDSADPNAKDQPLEPERITEDEWVRLAIAHRHPMPCG